MDVCHEVSGLIGARIALHAVINLNSGQSAHSAGVATLQLQVSTSQMIP